MFLKNVINELGYNIDKVTLNVSFRPEFGDYQFSGVMSLSKKYCRNPREVAQSIVDKLKVMNRYKDINVAKALHVCHLRSANIGEALKRLASSLKYKIISDAHLGDWGRPIGLVMLEVKKRNSQL